jgi:hypothetical protein
MSFPHYSEYKPDGAAWVSNAPSSLMKWGLTPFSPETQIRMAAYAQKVTPI